MKIGLHIANFTWPGGPPRLGDQLAAVAGTADDVGFHTISVMDHFFQIANVGATEDEMLEAYTTLGYLAAHTSRAKLLALVTAAVYRNPAILAKMVSTLDVLSGGRAWLGVGAAWNAEESAALGLDFPPLTQRYERLEEAVQIVRRMWSDDESGFAGPFHTVERALNSPQPLTRPHPPILIGGGGERKTLRLVARYADACNLLAGTDIPHKLDVLRQHCATEGRDYDEIHRTATMVAELGDKNERIGEVIDQLRELAGQGIQTAILGVPRIWELKPLELIGREIIPAVADL